MPSEVSSFGERDGVNTLTVLIIVTLFAMNITREVYKVKTDICRPVKTVNHARKYS